MEDVPFSSTAEKIALVTGAAGIVGPGVCEELREAGWKVAATEYSEENFARYQNYHQKPVAADLLIAADLSVRGDCFRLVEEVREKLGPIALLVNGATGNSNQVVAGEITEADCQRVLGVDLLAPLYLTQAATEDLARSRGLVVNFSSVRLQTFSKGALLYVVAKAGIEKMTEALALELAERGIRVNTLRLGSIPGDAFLRSATKQLPTALAAQLRADIIPKHLEASAGSTLIRKVGRPSDIGKMIVYLASPAGEFINAAVIPLDGGFGLVQQQKAMKTPGGSSLPGRWIADPEGELKTWLQEKGITHEI